MDTADVTALYRRYLACCNNRRWDELRAFAGEIVLVNGRARTRDQYIDDIRTTIEIFPEPMAITPDRL